MQLPIGRRITYRDITAEGELELIRLCQAGDTAAGGVLIRANEPLIYTKVRRYFRKGLPAEDIMQWARIGYYRAIMRFDPSFGVRLNAYAIPAAQNEALSALQDTGSTIRVPGHVQDELYKAARGLVELDVDLEHALRLRRTRSLDVAVGASGTTRGELTADEALPPDAAAVEADAQARRKDLILRAMTWLTARQREVVERHFLAEEPETFTAIGASMGVTKQRAEQIKHDAVGKLNAALRRLAQPGDELLWGAREPLKPLAETARAEAESAEVVP